jgi:hypothetical protein
MNFKEAFKEVQAGKRLIRPTLNVNLQDGPVEVKYMSCIVPTYVEMDGSPVKQDMPFLALFDVKGGVHKLSEGNIISLLMGDDEDWVEYVEPAKEETPVPVEEAAVEPVIEDAIVEPIAE